MGLRDGFDQAGEIAFQMHPEGKEIGNYQDSRRALRHKCGNGASERRLAQFEKSGFHAREIAGAGEIGSDVADGLVGGLNAGAVGKDDNASVHRCLARRASRVGKKYQTNPFRGSQARFPRFNCTLAAQARYT